MHIIDVYGGLGNQMYQVAFGKTLEIMGKKVKYDIQGTLFGAHGQNVFKIFNLDCIFATKKEVHDISGIYRGKYADIFYRFLRKFTHGKKVRIFTEEMVKNNIEEIFSHRDMYLRGYWANYKYFDKYRSDILKMYSFNVESTDICNLSMHNMIIQSKNSISIHIRRGDYLSKNNQKIFGSICTEQYYNRAIEYFTNKYNVCNFFVFSDDIEYASKMFKGKDFTFVDINSGEDSWKDMWLMSQCDHNIIANSTFSWWAAYLNSNEDKVVVAPEKFNNLTKNHDYCPCEWMCIDIN